MTNATARLIDQEGRSPNSSSPLTPFLNAKNYTDHFLVVGSVMLKLKNAYHKKSSKKRYDERLLKNEKIRKDYSNQLRYCLRTKACTCLTGDVENRWNNIKNGFCKAAEATLK